MKMTLTTQQQNELIVNLKSRFNANPKRHDDMEWQQVERRLKANPEKLWSLYKMEETGGEPDVVGYDEKTDECIFYDCSAESPKGRRSFCYDNDALEVRKKHKPKNSAMGFATEIGVELLNEAQYRKLQKLGKFDTKTSSWLKTPSEIRKLGGAIFGDFRFNTVFVYHNGVQSYYAGRGFRALLKV
ncbi:DUF4256 domain-containing protein [Aequorivita sp. F47161]|uniref:DUF4256 domain-containing protein n=1 Tax=Aequorivita vitellina TaxID=2874475 RepID=A0A9X1U9M1_9FLAO|nr:DUF4256 domain-containing protein [Aequorivita vitellina]MCG2418701.1 DUF4256 domain-containing protein [Aequorivita vitellina]